MPTVKQESSNKKASSTNVKDKARKPARGHNSKGNQRAQAKAKAKAKANANAGKEQSNAELECMDAQEMLQRAAHHAAGLNSKAIADKLAAKAAQGNAASTKMLITLMGGKLPRKQKPGELTFLQELALDKPWEGKSEDLEKEDADTFFEREWGPEFAARVRAEKIKEQGLVVSD